LFQGLQCDIHRGSIPAPVTYTGDRLRVLGAESGLLDHWIRQSGESVNPAEYTPRAGKSWSARMAWACQTPAIARVVIRRISRASRTPQLSSVAGSLGAGFKSSETRRFLKDESRHVVLW